ncbi:MAG: type II CAAX endopeptidase family protein [Candidatus Thermoplasmatota archaeon]|nr:type II CAAX endopeptidase family protein [Candidatus Thermoplasmatota archaeon]
MDFDIKKPTHILALLLVAVTFLVFIVLPVLSYFGMPLSTQTDQIEDVSDSFRILFEIIVLFIQLVFVVALFIAVPLLWYRLVNKFNLKQMFSHLKLRTKGIDEAFLWGILTMIFAFAIIIAIGAVMTYLGFDLTDSSNIPELESYFSLPLMLVLIAFQPIGEEIFFRGFLLEKFNSLVGKEVAIIATALLFGVAHLSFGNVYPAIITVIVGLLLAFLVIKTKNLYSAITAHILFNLVSFSFYILGKSV